MNQDDYVSYELAVKLKDAGFDEPCDHCYAKTSDSEYELIQMTTSRDYNKPRDGEPPFLSPICSAVPLWQAQKWLREKKHLSVEPYANIVANFNYNIADLESFADYKGHYEGQGIGYESYECALAAGLFAALELIKNGE